MSLLEPFSTEDAVTASFSITTRDRSTLLSHPEQPPLSSRHATYPVYPTWLVPDCCCAHRDKERQVQEQRAACSVRRGSGTEAARGGIAHQQRALNSSHEEDWTASLPPCKTFPCPTAGMQADKELDSSSKPLMTPSDTQRYYQNVLIILAV